MFVFPRILLFLLVVISLTLVFVFRFNKWVNIFPDSNLRSSRSTTKYYVYPSEQRQSRSDEEHCMDTAKLPVLFTTSAGQYKKAMSILRSSPLIPRRLNVTQYFFMLGLTEIVDILMTEGKINYFLGDGNAIGAFLVHDLLPWDDDLDVHCDENMIETFQHQVNRWNNDSSQFRPLMYDNGVIPRKATIQFWHQGSAKWKFYLSDYYSQTPYSWKWPFCDIYFDSSIGRHSPIVYRPYGPMLLPFPYSFAKYTTEAYGSVSDKCSSYGWDHVNECGRADGVEVDCELVKNDYPFVNRTIVSHNCMKEVLAINGIVLHVAYVHGEL